MKRCEFSPDRLYRYTLWRTWDGDLFSDAAAQAKHATYLQIIGLNPSTADERDDDPTIRRCIGFAKQWGYGALCMTNLFAWRATKPAVMMAATDPIGPDNDAWLARMAKDAGMVLAAWGNRGNFKGRDRQVLASLGAQSTVVHCFRTNDDGSPEHPLYMPHYIEPVRFQI